MADPQLTEKKSALEREIEQMMEQTQGLLKGTKVAQRDAERVRRKSKELESELNDMAAAAEAWNAIGGRLLACACRSDGLLTHLRCGRPSKPSQLERLQRGRA